MTSRDTVLTRIRAALAADGPATPIPREYIRRGANDPGSEHVIELLVDRLVDYKALVDRVSAADLPGAVDAALRGLGSVVVAPDLEPAIAAACATGDRRVFTDTAPQAPVAMDDVVRRNPALTPQELDAIDAVVTTARVAIAMSGTIILDGGPGQGRRAITLVPDLHVVILTAEQIVETVAEAIAALTPIAPLTMIAGPSATSDIELERVEGVHGPRTLHVIIVG
jgi:L-lactate dehydrogenase complex protein LldG